MLFNLLECKHLSWESDENYTDLYVPWGSKHKCWFSRIFGEWAIWYNEFLRSTHRPYAQTLDKKKKYMYLWLNCFSFLSASSLPSIPSPLSFLLYLLLPYFLPFLIIKSKIHQLGAMKEDIHEIAVVAEQRNRAQIRKLAQWAWHWSRRYIRWA